MYVTPVGGAIPVPGCEQTVSDDKLRPLDTILSELDGLILKKTFSTDDPRRYHCTLCTPEGREITYTHFEREQPQIMAFNDLLIYDINRDNVNGFFEC